MIGVRTASPASRVDVRVGDILVAVNGQSVATPVAAVTSLEAAKGNVVEVVLTRDGAPISKKMTIPVGTW